MDVAWWIWLLVSLVIGVVEVSTLTFVLLWIAVAGILTSLLSALTIHVGLTVQVLFFVIISAVLIAVTRPLVKKWRNHKADGYDPLPHRLVGKMGVVVADATTTKNAVIRVDGEMWSAESAYSLHIGQQVIVDAATSAVLAVHPIEEV